jgi:hypothetical protein
VLEDLENRRGRATGREAVRGGAPDRGGVVVERGDQGGIGLGRRRQSTERAGRRRTDGAVGIGKGVEHEGLQRAVANPSGRGHAGPAILRDRRLEKPAQDRQCRGQTLAGRKRDEPFGLHGRARVVRQPMGHTGRRLAVE